MRYNYTDNTTHKGHVHRMKKVHATAVHVVNDGAISKNDLVNATGNIFCMCSFHWETHFCPCVFLDFEFEAKNDKIDLLTFARQEDVELGNELPNCGLKTACSTNFFDIYIHSGTNKDNETKICINSRLYKLILTFYGFLLPMIFSVFQKSLNNAGRGLNLAVVNSSSRDVLRIGHFDTYAQGLYIK